MSRKSAFVTASTIASAAILGAACTPVTSYNGFQARDTKPADMKVGEDTRTTVEAKLGSPSTKSTFDDSTWYYISQTSEKASYHLPKVVSRNVVAVSFGKDDKVAGVKTYLLKDGYKVAYDGRETPTRGRQLNWLEQILGTIGRGGVLPQDNDPGAPGSRH